MRVKFEADTAEFFEEFFFEISKKPCNYKS